MKEETPAGSKYAGWALIGLGATVGVIGVVEFIGHISGGGHLTGQPLPPGIRPAAAGLCLAGAGEALRQPREHGATRDAVGRLLHLLYPLVVYVGVIRLIESMAPIFSNAYAEHRQLDSGAALRALAVFLVPLGVSWLLARWVSGFPPPLRVTVTIKVKE